MTESRVRIDVPRDQIVDFCRRHRIRWLAFFGSVLRDDFQPESDVDMLVEFEPDQRYTYFTLAQIEEDLSEPPWPEGGSAYPEVPPPVHPRQGAREGGGGLCRNMTTGSR